MSKTTILLSAGAGYVLGARAGRERYEQIVSTYQRLRSNPKVQQTVSQVQGQAGVFAGRAKDSASSTVHSVKERRSGGQEPDYDVVELPGTYAQTGGTGTVDGLE